MTNFGRIGAVGAGLAAVLCLGGCVVVVGNDLDGHTHEWRDEEQRPRIGVTLGSVDDALASQLNVNADDSTLILGVIGNMPAEKAGVKVHDVVVQIDGSDRASPDDLRRAIRGKAAGEELKLRVIRAGQPVELTVVMDKGATSGENP